MFESLNMDSKDVVMTIAVILGPILAVQAQKLVESFREKRSKRMEIFKTLMATRAERLSREHVQALNMIDIEFYGRMIPFIKTRYQSKKEQSVTHAWKIYNNHLYQKAEYETDDLWIKTGDKLFTELLYSMAQSLGYDYDKVQLQRDCYRPEAHSNIENAQLGLLDGLNQVINNGRPIPMNVVNLPVAEAQSVETET